MENRNIFANFYAALPQSVDTTPERLHALYLIQHANRFKYAVTADVEKAHTNTEEEVYALAVNSLLSEMSYADILHLPTPARALGVMAVKIAKTVIEKYNNSDYDNPESILNMFLIFLEQEHPSMISQGKGISYSEIKVDIRRFLQTIPQTKSNE